MPVWHLFPGSISAASDDSNHLQQAYHKQFATPPGIYFPLVTWLTQIWADFTMLEFAHEEKASQRKQAEQKQET